MKLKIYEIKALSSKIAKEINEENNKLDKKLVDNLLEEKVEIKFKFNRLQEVLNLIEKLEKEKNDLRLELRDMLPNNFILDYYSKKIEHKGENRYITIEDKIMDDIVVANIEGSVDELIEKIKNKYINK